MNKQVLSRQSISLQNKLSDAGKLSDFLAEHAKTSEIPDEIYHDLRLVIEEVFVNIASYAYAEEDRQPVTIELSRSTNEISITFTDAGIAFNPLTDPAECKDTDDHCEGGMGIHIIKSLTDQQKYRRINQHNVFTVTKHYTK